MPVAGRPQLSRKSPLISHLDVWRGPCHEERVRRGPNDVNPSLHRIARPPRSHRGCLVGAGPSPAFAQAPSGLPTRTSRRCSNRSTPDATSLKATWTAQFKGSTITQRERRDEGIGRSSGLSGQHAEAEGSIYARLRRQRRSRHGPQAIDRHQRVHAALGEPP